MPPNTTLGAPSLTINDQSHRLHSPSPHFIHNLIILERIFYRTGSDRLGQYGLCEVFAQAITCLALDLG